MGLFPETATLPNTGFVASNGYESLMYLATSGAGVIAQNMIYLCQVRIEAPVTFVAMGWLNGATTNGQCAAGIYSFGGTRLDYTAHTGQSGASTTQVAALTNANVALSPGRYWLAFGSDSATATFHGPTPDVNLARVAYGASQVASAYANPLPSSITPAWPLTSAKMPLVFASTTANL
jgi:hypothetical protein